MDDKRSLAIPGLPRAYVEDLLTASILSVLGILLIWLGPGKQLFGIDIIPDAVALPVLVLCGFIGSLYAPLPVISSTSFLLGLGIDLLAGGHEFALWLIFQLVFALVGHAPQAISKWIFKLTLISTGIAGVAAFASGFDISMAFQFALLTALILFIPALWASNVREHANAARAERARADAQAQLLTLATQNAEADAKIAEQKTRGAAAEDLHDLVAGHISAIALQSQAALASRDEDLRTQVLRTVHASADRALNELRRMIEVLSSDAETPDPATASVEETVDLARSLGIEVTGAAVIADLGPQDESALRPVFAELVANIMKHAAVKEMVLSSPRRGTITVSNAAHMDSIPGQEAHRHEGRPRFGPGSVVDTAAGHGLHNIAGRMERLGGSARFSADDGRFTVTLTLPDAKDHGVRPTHGTESSS